MTRIRTRGACGGGGPTGKCHKGIGGTGSDENVLYLHLNVSLLVHTELDLQLSCAGKSPASLLTVLGVSLLSHSRHVHTHLTSGTSGQQRCGSFPSPSRSLRRQPGLLQFHLILTLSASPGWRLSCPRLLPPHFKCQSQVVSRSPGHPSTTVRLDRLEV